MAGIYINDGGTWRTVRPWINDAGTWRGASKVYVNDGGTWRLFYQAAFSFTLTSGQDTDGVNFPYEGYSNANSSIHATPLGSVSSNTLPDGKTICTYLRLAVSGTNTFYLEINGFTSDPGTSYISSVAITDTSGTNTRTSASATYTYNAGAGRAQWQWGMTVGCCGMYPETSVSQTINF